MKIQHFFARALLGVALFAIASWTFGFTWSASWAASENLVNAVEAGVPDTVSQSTWLEIILGLLALISALNALVNVITLKFLTMFNALERSLVFALPISIVSLTPLIGAPTPLLPILVIIVCVTLRSEKHARLRSS